MHMSKAKDANRAGNLIAWSHAQLARHEAHEVDDCSVRDLYALWPASPAEVNIR